MDINKQRIWILTIISILAVIIIISLGTIGHSLDLLIKAGISKDILYLILVLPFIGLFLSFSRIMIGVNVQGASVPVITIISAFILGPLITFELLLIGLIFGYISKLSILDLRLHFAVKVSIILTILTIGLLFSLPIINLISPFPQALGASIIVFGILLIALFNDKYLTFKVTKNSIKKNFKNIVNTFIFSYISYFLLGGLFVINNSRIHFSYLQSFINQYPDSIFLALLLTIIIGSYSGLMLTELFRFRKLIFKSK